MRWSACSQIQMVCFLGAPNIGEFLELILGIDRREELVVPNGWALPMNLWCANISLKMDRLVESGSLGDFSENAKVVKRKCNTRFDATWWTEDGNRRRSTMLTRRLLSAILWKEARHAN